MTAVRLARAMEFKVANEDWEFDLIHQLNYDTFVEEIPQHRESADKKLVDKFHRDNTYFICVRDRRLLGMISVHDQRPFSLDVKLDNLNAYLPPFQSACEVRLLSVEANHRNGPVLKGLLKILVNHCLERGYDLALISGLERQKRLYRHLGFIPFGPPVGSAGASYQPMYLSLNRFVEETAAVLDGPAGHRQSAPAANFLPGPVCVDEKVRESFAEPPTSHRSIVFVKDVRDVRKRLCRMVGAQSVAIFMGSGTLANDVVAGQLSLQSERGAILSNGEFGERLIKHATAFGLAFKPVRNEWGEPFVPEQIETFLDNSPRL